MSGMVYHEELLVQVLPVLQREAWESELHHHTNEIANDVEDVVIENLHLFHYHHHDENVCHVGQHGQVSVRKLVMQRVSVKVREMKENYRMRREDEAGDTISKMQMIPKSERKRERAKKA